MAEKKKSFSRSPSSSVPPGRLVSRKIPSQNIVSRLIARELYGTTYRYNKNYLLSRRVTSMFTIFRRNSLNTIRGFHLNIVPNYTLVNVEKVRECSGQCGRTKISPYPLAALLPEEVQP